MTLVWYDAKNDEIFTSPLFDTLFFTLSFRPGFFIENPHIDIIGSL